MRIYLARHARAVDAGSRLRDEDRFLTSEGRRAARAVGTALRREGHTFDAVLTSPLVRAVQTAEILAERTDFTGVVEALAALSPGVPARAIAAELAAYGARVLVVAHMPGIAMLGALLVGLPSFPPFHPGQVSLVEDGQPIFALDPITLEFERLLAR
ncbi:MAG: hypothetical protein EXR73_11870 [Myxococcales bacterium]|nr:hypothetical protein [Myxococcales bacterium]